MLKKLLLFILLFPSFCLAQTHTFPAEDTNNTFTGSNAFSGDVFTHLVQYTVATLPLPANAATGLIVVVTDGTNSADCTSGGGSYDALCRNSGSAWVALGGISAYPGSGIAVSTGSGWGTSLTKSGNTNEVASWSGAATPSRCAHTDASGNLVAASGDCSAGSVVPGTPLNSIQYNNASAFGGAGGITTPDGNSLVIKGNNPHFDVQAYGAVKVSGSAMYSSTASCTSGSPNITSAAAGPANGQGITIYGCGATNTMATPNTPTVTPFNSQTLTVPNPYLATIAAGSSTYSYLLVARDQGGAVTAPGTAATIATGPAALGEQTYTIATESLSGNTLTVATTVANGLTAGTLVHLSYSTNPALSGYYNVSAITNSNTFTIKNLPIWTEGTISSTGGNLVYYVGNHVTFTYSMGEWENFVCAERPGDVAYHIIGVTLPYNTAADGNGAGSLEFTDWGSTLTTAPILPPFATDAICTGTATNDQLTTTVVSGGGTTSFVVADNASQNASGQTALFDDGPAFKAAIKAIHDTFGGGILWVAPTGNGTYGTEKYVINSFTDLSGAGAYARMEIAGVIQANDTIIPPDTMEGVTAQSGGSFQLGDRAIINCNGAWPCIYPKAGDSGQQYHDFSLVNLAGGNQSLLFLWDSGGYSTLHDINVTTGSTTADYSGIGILMRPAGFNMSVHDISWNTGPGQSGSGYIDKSWTPEFYVAWNQSISGTVWPTPFDRITGTTRGFYWTSDRSYTPAEVNNVYIQGSIMPPVTIQGIENTAYNALSVLGDISDSSPVTALALLGTTSSTMRVNLKANLSPSAQETYGYPLLMSGVAPDTINFMDSNQQSQSSAVIQPYNWMNVINSETRKYYANDHFNSSGPTSTNPVSRGEFNVDFPITSQSGSFVPLGIPSQSTPSASAGGSAPIGASTFCVYAIGWNGGWSLPSCQTITVVSGTQTIDLSWSSVTGAQGYIAVDNTTCIPTDCATYQTATTLHYTGGGSGIISVPLTGKGAVAQGATWQGLYGSQWTTYQGVYNTVITPVTLTANRTIHFPDANGTLCVDSGGCGTTVNSQTCTIGSTCTIPFQTNSVNNTSQAGVNFLNNSAANGVNFINPGTNQIQASLANTSGGGTSVALFTPTSPVQKDFLGYNVSGVLVNMTPGVPGRSVSGTTDTINCAAGGDRGTVVTYTSASLVTVTIGQAGVTCASNFYVRLWSTGAGGMKVVTTASTINGIAGATGVTYPGNTWVDLISTDNANYTATASRAVKAGTNMTETLNADDTVSLNGSTQISGLTTGYLPKATSGTAIGNSLCDEGITTASTMTCTDTAGIAAPKYTSTGTTAGFIDFPQGTTSAAVAPCNTATSICEQAPASVTSYLVTKPGAAPNIASYKQTDACGSASCTESYHPVPAILTVASDFTTAANTNLQTITGLSTTMPASKAVVAVFHCSLNWSQATATAAVAFGIQGATTAPTNLAANATSYTNTTAETTGTLTGLTTTTATNIVSVAPSAITTIWKAIIDGTLEAPSNASPTVLNFMVSTATSGDAVTVKRGSYCSVIYQ